MTTPRRRLLPALTPTRLLTAAGARAEMPEDFVAEAVRRLRVLAGLILGLSLVAGVVVGVAVRPQFQVLPPAVHVALFALNVGMALGVLVLLSRDVAARTKLRVGGYWYIGMAWCTAFAINAVPWPPQLFMPSWSPGAVWLLVFPLFLMMPPRRAAVNIVLAAAGEPLAIAVLAASGAIDPTPQVLAMRLAPLLGAMILAYVLTTAMWRVNRRVAEAREIGAYTLRSELGAGGMGEVWAADHRMLARPAAIKLIRAEKLGVSAKDSLALMKRFEREAQATAALRSPHTISLYDFGLADDGSFYYVMELLDGIDLEQLVERHGPQPAERVIHILRQACHSLHEAHLAGMIHRDIKPANIFLCRYGADVDFVKVLDFGLVKHSGLESQQTMLTGAGTSTGTPAFMPPELVLAEGPIDGRADLYALGCVGYWLLTGKLVFEGASAIKVMIAHAQHEPAPASERSELPIPPALDALLLSCLAKDPDARPQTARELLARLNEIDAGADWSATRAERWWEHHAPKGES